VGDGGSRHRECESNYETCAYLNPVALLCLAAVGLQAQQSDAGQAVLTVRSTLVQAPALVKTKGGQVLLKLTADDYFLTYNGEPQVLTLDQGTDAEPLALVIAVETGGAGANHLLDYRQLYALRR
jgi:hypothetical protein